MKMPKWIRWIGDLVLIEWMLIFAIGGILASVAIPAYKSAKTEVRADNTKCIDGEVTYRGMPIVSNGKVLRC